MSIQAPVNFKEWILNNQEIITSIKNNSKLPDKGKFSYVDSNMSDAMTLAVSAVSGVIGMGPAGAFVSSIFSTLFNIIYNNLNDENIDGDVWTSFSKYMDKVIEAAFSRDHQKDVLAIVSGLNVLVAHYVRARVNFEKAAKTDSDYQDHRIHLVKQFEDLNKELEIVLAPRSQLRTELYSVQDLGAFALIATTHILLLRDFIKEGKEWGSTIYEHLKAETPVFEQKYYEHTAITFNEGIKKIEQLSLSGHEVFCKILEFRSYCARFVFDIIDSWFLFDRTIFTNGGYKENIRYVWYDGKVGVPVNNSQTPKEYSNGSEVSSYYLTPLSQIKKNFDDANAEQYKHDLLQIKVYRDDKWIYAIQPEYSGPTENVTENRFGSKNTTFGANKMVYTSVLPRSFSQSQVRVLSDLVPRYLSIGNFEILPFVFASSASLKLSPGSGAIKEIYKYPVQEKNATISNHKVAKLFGHSRNLEALNHGSTNLIPTSDGCCDNLYIGYSQNGVISDNNLFADKPTCINAQKYESSTGNVQFKKDHVLPTVHSMFVPAKATLTFNTKFAFSNSTVKKYKVGFRYHHNETSGNCEVNIKDAKGTVGDKIFLPNTQLSLGSLDTNLFNYNVVFSKRVLDFSLGSNVTFVSNGNVFLHSIILTPA